MLTRITSFQTQLENEQKAHPDLAVLDEQIKRQGDTYEAALKKQNACAVSIQTAASHLANLKINLE